MKLDITDVHFIELQKKGYTIDMILILSWLNKNLSITHILEESKKIQVIYKTMKRKGLITDDDKLSQIGIELLDFVSKKTNIVLMKPKVESTEFDKWWIDYPANDHFIVKGKSFGPSRSFKTKKDDCRLLFNKMILDGLFTAQQIYDATQYDINLKKERSYKTGSNQLKYLQNSYTYLYQKTFEGFINMKNKGQIKETTNLGSVDI